MSLKWQDVSCSVVIARGATLILLVGSLGCAIERGAPPISNVLTSGAENVHAAPTTEATVTSAAEQPETPFLMRVEGWMGGGFGVLPGGGIGPTRRADLLGMSFVARRPSPVSSSPLPERGGTR